MPNGYDQTVEEAITARNILMQEVKILKAALETRDERIADDQETEREVSRLLGFALFNLSKGNVQEAETLVGKAFTALTGDQWQEGEEKT